MKNADLERISRLEGRMRNSAQKGNDLYKRQSIGNDSYTEAELNEQLLASGPNM